MDPKLIALLPFTLIIALSTFLLWKLLPGTKPFDYGLTIDAGSSHSEVILFTWSNKMNGTGFAEQIGNEEISTGIDDHGEDIESTVGEMYTAVARTVSRIPENVPGPFPLFLGATAGIRILNLTKPELVSEIMTSLNSNLSDSSFGGRSLSVKQVRVLRGTEEGLYAWVTANYLTNFRPEDRSTSSNFRWINETTIGVLDMGGASSQIAYETVEGTNQNDDRSIDSVNLFGKKFTVQSHSNLCFGSDQGYYRYLFELVLQHLNGRDGDYVTTRNKSPELISIPDPCNHDSPAESYTANQFISNPCLATQSPVNLRPDMRFTFEPAMNHSKCASIIIDLIDTSYCEKFYSLCPKSDPGPIPANTHFYAISSYFFSTKVLPTISNGNDVFTNDRQYLKQVAHWCTKPWTEKVQLVDPQYARYLCFKQLYIFYTLKTIYQFTDDQWPYIHFRNKIEESSLGWSLGYMLIETNVIPSKPTQPLVWTAYAFYGSIGLLVGVSLFLFSYWICKRSKSAVINQKA